VHINCYSKIIYNNEKIFSYILLSEWAHETLEEIQELDLNGLLLPILFYADRDSTGMNVKRKLHLLG